MNDAGHPNWSAITASAFPWEKEALDYIQDQFPSHEPYRAWSNFEFIADDGSVNEVDLLVFTPQGFFLVEIKSHPGILSGDSHTWTWKNDGHSKVTDNPVFLANQKAKKLASLLQRQRAFDHCRVPFIEPLIFCSAESLQSQLLGNASFHVCLRDQPDKPGIMAALKRRECPGLSAQPRGTFDRPTAKAVARALEQIGIKPSQRSRRVGDYQLQGIIDEGPGYQDFLARHISLQDTWRRVRIYLVSTETNADQRLVIQRAAEREFRLLQALEHRGVLRALEFTNHELGPAIFFQHFPKAVRLDHFLIQRKEHITDDLRLSLMRQIAETISFAHGKHVVHRNLSPRTILIANPESANPQTLITNWQLGYRRGATGDTTVTHEVTGTIHVDKLAEETTMVFMAPEAILDLDNLGEHHDIFSLGAVCYQLFTGQAPAESTLSLAEILRVHRGLRVSAVLNGAPESLDMLVQCSTDPDVSNRLDSVDDFIEYLDQVEDELTAPRNAPPADPTLAKPGDILPGGYEVVRHLGAGSTAKAFLVCKDGKQVVAKIAVDTDHNNRVKDEGEVLKKLNSPLIVQCHNIIEIADRTAILLDQAGDKTLRKRLNEEGRLSLDLLQRFGEDLLEAVVVLERAGIAHRDIKPDNIGVSAVGRGNALHLVLFDFSLSRCSPENIRAGTPGYLDPFLPLRKPPRWDLQAERFSAAVTLYQMATGAMPVWHDGKTDPTMIEAEVTIDADRFNSDLRDQFTGFFRQALRRNPRERFDNAHQMLEAWQNIFNTAAATPTVTSEGAEPDNAALLAAATVDTNVAELGLSPAAVDALDRINVVKVSDLLLVLGRRLARMRGVGNKTRKQILAAVKVLRERLGPGAVAGSSSASGSNSDSVSETATISTDDAYTYDGPIPKGEESIDVLVQRILRVKAQSRTPAETTAFEQLLGLDQGAESFWPSQGDTALRAGVARGRISEILTEAQARWSRDPVITALRDQIAALLETNGGVMSAAELCETLLIARGSIEDEPRRSRLALVVTRAAVETEILRDDPKFIVRRVEGNALVATDMSLADYAAALGQRADQIAREDPLVPPVRVLDMLREVPVPPEAQPLPDARLLRLATAASQHAAISSKRELYPRNMDAGRAIRLSHGGLVGVAFLTPDQIAGRVSSRYPAAAALPARPTLDNLLADAGLDLIWNADRPGGSAYVSTARNVLSVTDASSTLPRYSTEIRTAGTPAPNFRPAYLPPEVDEAKAFEERLRYAEKHGSFLALTVKLGLYHGAFNELANRFATRPLDLERVFLERLRNAADEVGADWTVVVNADAAERTSQDWHNLNHLIASNVIPQVEQAVVADNAAGKTVLAYNLNWLKRYGQVVMLTRIAQAVQDGRLHGAWLLIPASPQTDMPLLDGDAVPVLTANQWAHIPESWRQNLHRTDIKKNGSPAAAGAGGQAEGT